MYTHIYIYRNIEQKNINYCAYTPRRAQSTCCPIS